MKPFGKHGSSFMTRSIAQPIALLLPADSSKQFINKAAFRRNIDIGTRDHDSNAGGM